MPWLRTAHTDEQTQDFFARVVKDCQGACWVTRRDGKIVAYMLINGDEIDHLYVAPR